MTQTLNRFTDAPVFAGFLIDASGSMKPYKNDVIEGHRGMLASLREAEKCEKGVLYVSQALFADVPQQLHGFYPLDRGGVGDHVAILDDRNYEPSGMTALYDAICQMATEMEAHFEAVTKQGFVPEGRIAVITDGAENNSKATRADVLAAIQRLRSREWLRQSVIVGLTNPDFDDGKLEDLRQAVGFSQQISLTRDPRQIRRAFILASKVGGGK